MKLKWIKVPENLDMLERLAVVIAFIIMLFMFNYFCHGDEASYYTEESCRREGTSGICANGEVYDDDKYTAASWDYAFGTRLRVTNRANGKSVILRVNDRGPNRKLYRQGRTLDLSKAAFASIANLREGVIQITQEEI